MPNDKILKQKQEEVKKLADKFKASKVVLLTDYRGITVEDVTKLRNTLRNEKAEYCVIKNNITKRALEANDITQLNELLEGPTAVIMGNEDYLRTNKSNLRVHKNK